MLARNFECLWLPFWLEVQFDCLEESKRNFIQTFDPLVTSFQFSNMLGVMSRVGKYLPVLAGGSLTHQMYGNHQSMHTHKPSIFLVPWRTDRFKPFTFTPCGSRMVDCAGSPQSCDEDEDPGLAQALVDAELLEQEHGIPIDDLLLMEIGPNPDHVPGPAGVPRPLAACWGTDAPAKLTFARAMDKVLKESLVLSNIDTTKGSMNIVDESKEQVADLLDLPLSPDAPTGQVSQIL